MAPRSPPKRLTRARAAAGSTSIALDGPSRKIPSTKVVKPVDTRKSKPVKVEVVEQPTEIVKSARAIVPKASTRSAPTTSALSAAPRRRVKVTPLDAPAAIEESVQEEYHVTRKSSTRSKKGEEPEVVEDKKAEKKSQHPISRKKNDMKNSVQQSNEDESTAKSRKKPKKAPVPTADQSASQAIDLPTRRTRSHSHSSTIECDIPINLVVKTTAVPRKKVTFEDIPDNDKENRDIVVKKDAGKNGNKQDESAKGLRAKPVRKPTASGVRKKTAPPTSKARANKQLPRILTPKKITQVARSTTSNDSDEDELNGGKTPMRDLSQSPIRLPKAAIPLSPVKKLDFGMTLAANLPHSVNEPTVLLSPPRRPLQSSQLITNSNSPIRLETSIQFPQPSSSIAMLKAPIDLTTSNLGESMLLQSPKRAGLNMSSLAPSNMKSPKSPFKTSFLQSPAKRFVSPVKLFTKSAMPTKSNIGEVVNNDDLTEDVTVTSHFRQTSSPQRSAKVHRMSKEELAEQSRIPIDFDESVLSIRSPLKVSQVDAEPMEIELADDNVGFTETDINKEESVAVDSEIVEPVEEAQAEETSTKRETLDQDPESGNVSQHEFDEESVNPSDLQQCHESTEAEEHEKMVLVTENFDSASKRYRDAAESSEDELSAERTPVNTISRFRAGLTGATSRGRDSLGLPSSTSRKVGFTPLANQMDIWRASSPRKHTPQRKYQTRGMFSPIATQHVPGEVQITRQLTPRQERSGDKADLNSHRKSLAKRLSMAPSNVSSPERPSEFADEMAIRDIQQQLDQATEKEQDTLDVDLHHSMNDEANGRTNAMDDSAAGSQANDSADDSEDDVSDDSDIAAPGELTTDLIKFTHASDTAMIDFATLAQEADDMAKDADDYQQDLEPTSTSHEQEEDEITAKSQNDVEDNVDEVIQPDHVGSFQTSIDSNEASPRVTPAEVFQDSEALSSSEECDNSHEQASDRIKASIENVTPIRPNLSQPRIINTVISKVPLRPEGAISPIKMPKKRSRSMSASQGPAKRVSLGLETSFPISVSTPVAPSPARRIRSAAPSPAWSTPGQMSFAISDFGDSTLDDIDIPEDELEDGDQENTSLQIESDSPVTVRSIMLSTAVNNTTPARTPLKAVGAGVLHGAIVFVDVHTTEGADASGIFIELLNQMGARCVKEWRWNPRTSTGGIGADSNATPGKIGITHVVFKDGGKRILEKVRDARGEVCCVGVGWVLECEKQNKWLEETPYLVDSTILPRGGSRRRKSMEPRALINENGSVSTAKTGRRSVSTPMMKQIQNNMLNNAARDDQYFVTSEGKRRLSESSSTFNMSNHLQDEDESEISSTYNSPSMTMTTQVLLGYQRPERRSSSLGSVLKDGDNNEEEDSDDGDEVSANDQILPATPTMGIVDYDPRTAMTPATPYFVQQGKQLIQMSCPPKQNGENLFVDVSAKNDLEKVDAVKKSETGKRTSGKFKLNVDHTNRRRTLGVPTSENGSGMGMWKPKIRSPLGKGF